MSKFLIIQNRELVKKKLNDIMTYSVEDQNPEYFYINEEYKSNDTFNVKIKETFFIQCFLNHEYADIFELQEIYHNDSGLMSLYIKYVGE